MQVRVRHPPGGVVADRLEDVLHRHVPAAEAPGQNRAAVDEHRRHVQPDHRHHHAGQRLVASGEADQRVVAVAAHRQFDGIGDHLARDQRRLHAGMPHGDAVGDGDRRELARRAAAGLDAELHRLRLAGERDVARRRLVPAGGDADERPVDVARRQPHGIIVRAVRRPLRPDGNVPARQLRFVEHGSADVVGHDPFLVLRISRRPENSEPRKWCLELCRSDKHLVHLRPVLPPTTQGTAENRVKPSSARFRASLSVGRGSGSGDGHDQSVPEEKISQ